MKNVKTTLLISAIAAGLMMTAANAAPNGGMMPMAFADLDTNGDGSISQEELDAHKAARFAEMDTNGDGGLSAEELALNARKQRGQRMVSQLDSNGDGLIQIDELGKGQRGDPFMRMDANSDGSISEEEFNAAKEKMGQRGERGHGKGKGDCDGEGHGKGKKRNN